MHTGVTIDATFTAEAMPQASLVPRIETDRPRLGAKARPHCPRSVRSALVAAPRLPVIDFGPFESGGAGRDHVAAQIDGAAAEFGVFYVVGHGVEAAAIERLLTFSRNFLLGRPQLRQGLYLSAESAEVGEEIRAHGATAFAQLPGFEEAALDYMQELTGLNHHLMSAIGRGLNLGDHYFFDRYTGHPTRRLHIMNRPPARRGQSTAIPAAVEYADLGLLTVLYQDENGRLQIQHNDFWIDAPYVPGAFVVSVGDRLERLTAGRYTSALQRVVNHADRTRTSLSFFFDPGDDAVLRTLPGAVPVACRAPPPRGTGRTSQTR